LVGSIILASEVSLLLLVPTSNHPIQIKCAKNSLRYQVLRYIFHSNRHLQRIPAMIPSLLFEFCPYECHPIAIYRVDRLIKGRPASHGGQLDAGTRELKISETLVPDDLGVKAAQQIVEQQRRQALDNFQQDGSYPNT
jgi:hypothetical protein